MRLILGILLRQRGRRQRINFASRVEILLDHSTPWPSSATTHRAHWKDDPGKVHLFVASNEDLDSRRLWRFDAKRAFAWSGYAAIAVDGELNPSSETHGVYAAIRAEPGVLTGWTNVHRMEPLYVGETRDVFVISNSARLVSKLVSANRTIPPEEAIVSLAGPGFMLSNTTPYAGVHAVPSETVVTTRRRGGSNTTYRLPTCEAGRSLLVHASAIASSLLSAASAISEEHSDILCHITGGKDSRLALAALTAVGARIQATTTGFAEHPDVIIGAQVAKTVGVEHRVVSPSTQLTEAGRRSIVVNIDQRAWTTLRLTEGMLTAYETITANELSPFRGDTLVAGGHGGELLRGGYGYRLRAMNSEQAARRIELIAAPHRRLLTPLGSDVLEHMIGPWITRTSSSPARALADFYREYRAGRWHAVARSAYSIFRPQRTILGDDAVVRRAFRAPQELAWNERLFAAVLRKIDGSLLHIPFYQSRWKFEEGGPSDDFFPSQWQQRKPLLPSSPISVYNWRVDFPDHIEAFFRDRILSANDRYFELLDRKQVEAFLASRAVPRTGAQAKLVWSLYSAACLVEGLHHVHDRPPGIAMEIPLPHTA